MLTALEANPEAAWVYLWCLQPVLVSKILRVCSVEGCLPHSVTLLGSAPSSAHLPTAKDHKKYQHNCESHILTYCWREKKNSLENIKC